MKNNKFIVVEGIDCSGKTKTCNIIHNVLNQHNIKNIIVREPGSTPIAEKIRTIIKINNTYEYIHKKTILLLMYAARMQLLENIIKPALKNNIWIISDRHDLSSYAYQGGGFQINKDIIMMLKKNILGNLRPNLTIYLDVLPHIVIKRLLLKKNTDFIENNKLDFFIRTRQYYLKAVLQNKKNIIINTNLKENVVNQDIKNKFNTWVKNIL